MRLQSLFAITSFLLSLASAVFAAPRLQLEVVDVRALPDLTLQFTVLDSSGKELPGLRSEDFRFTFDGAAVEGLGVAPVSPESQRAVCVVLECSERLRGRDFFQVRNLVAEIADRLAPGDRIGLIAVSDSVRVASVLSTDRVQFKQALAELSLGSDNIILNAAVDKALEELRGAPEPHRAVVVLATGQGGVEKGLQDVVIAQARELRIPIHTFAAGLRYDGPDLPVYSEMTGGRSYPEPLSSSAADLVQRTLSGGSGRYTAQLRLEGALDERQHHALLEVFALGQSVNQEFSFLMSTGTGIPPDAMSEYFRRAAARQSWWIVYFGAIAGGLLGVFLRERLRIRSTMLRLMALAASLATGALLGFVLSRLSSS